MKDKVLAGVNAFPHSGLNVCRYFTSFVGKDFKGWAQICVICVMPHLLAMYGMLKEIIAVLECDITCLSYLDVLML